MQVGRRTLRNRIALPATLTNYGAGHLVTERWSNFLVERARGGAALLVSEVIAVDPQARANPAVVVGYDDRNNEAFKRTAHAVEQAGACLVGQLWHPGRQQLWHPTQSPQGVSDVPDPYSWTVPHVMSTADVRRLVDAFVRAAQRLADCGFGGAELHGAHGYLITQFFSRATNTREDDYGGPLENRVRFALEIATGIRASCGPEFVLGLKMPAREGVPDGIDEDEAVAISRHLANANAFDYYAYAQGNFSRSLEDHVPDLHYRPAHFVHLHRYIRERVKGVPIMAVGRIGTAALADEIVRDGNADLVAMCRAQVSDAAFAEKSRSGREQDIRPCVFDNACWGEVHQGKPLTEPQNPRLGEAGEAGWAPGRARSAKRLVVAGAGPAGLEAAWVAAARGHAVTLFGASGQAGGSLRLLATIDGQSEMGAVVEHQERMCNKHGVQMRLGERADEKNVAALKPDTVIIATGSSQSHPPDAVHDGDDRTLTARAYARACLSGALHSVHDDAQVRPGAAVLYDHDHGAGTYAMAAQLARRYERLLIITPRTDIAQGVNYCSRLGIYRRLHGAGVEILTAHEPLERDGNRLICRNVFSGARRSIEDAALLIYSTPRRARTSLAESLADYSPLLIGDCVSPRDLTSAIHEGHAAGCQV